MPQLVAALPACNVTLDEASAVVRRMWQYRKQGLVSCRAGREGGQEEGHGEERVGF